MDTRARRFRDNILILNEYTDYVIGQIGEAIRGMELSHLLDVAVEKHSIPGKIFATNIDKIIRVNNDFKAIFEIKYSTNQKNILMKYNHYKSLKLISRKLNIPVFIIVKSNGSWYVLDLDEINGFNSVGEYWNRKLKLSEMQKFSQAELVDFLAKVLGKEEEPGRSYYER